MTQPATLRSLDSAAFDQERHPGWSVWWLAVDDSSGRPMWCFTSAKAPGSSAEGGNPAEWVVRAIAETSVSASLDPLVFNVDVFAFTGDIMNFEQALESMGAMQDQLHSLILGTPVNILGEAFGADERVIEATSVLISNGSLPVDFSFRECRLAIQCAGLAIGVAGHNPQLVWASIQSIAKDLVREKIVDFLTDSISLGESQAEGSVEKAAIMISMAEFDQSRLQPAFPIEISAPGADLAAIAIPSPGCRVKIVDSWTELDLEDATPDELYGTEPMVNEGPRFESSASRSDLDIS